MAAEDNHQPEETEQFEINPKRERKIEGDVQIERTHHTKKTTPSEIQSRPHRIGEFQLLTHHGFYEIFFHQEWTEQQN